MNHQDQSQQHQQEPAQASSKATGEGQDPNSWPVISSYTRAQAIADGTLVDVTGTAREAGFKLPVALTAAAWADCVEWTAEDNKRKRHCQDQAGRLWDVLWMALLAARTNKSSADVLYTLHRVPREGMGMRPRLVQLRMTVGPGDTPEPVITIMTPTED